jgi:hypothetical protein
VSETLDKNNSLENGFLQNQTFQRNYSLIIVKPTPHEILQPQKKDLLQIVTTSFSYETRLAPEKPNSPKSQSNKQKTIYLRLYLKFSDADWKRRKTICRSHLKKSQKVIPLEENTPNFYGHTLGA